VHGTDRALAVPRAWTANVPQADAGAADDGARGTRLLVAGVALRQPLRRRMRAWGHRWRVDRLGDRLDDRLDRCARPRGHLRPAARLYLWDPLPVLRDRAAAGPGRPAGAAGRRDQVGHAFGAQLRGR